MWPALTELLGICRSRVFGLMNAGELASVEIGSGRRVPDRAVRDYVAQAVRGRGAMGTRKPNQRSSIFEGADGYWHGYVTVGHKPDGRLDRRHLQATTEAGVTTKVRKLERDRERGETKKAGRAPTVAAWMTTYLDTIAPQRVTPKMLDAYWSQATNWIIPNLGRHRLDRLAPEHLDRLYAVMLEAGRAPSMVLKTHRILSRALKIAHRRGHVNRNVALLVDPPSSPEVEQQQLTLAEARQVLAATAELRNGTRS